MSDYMRGYDRAIRELRDSDAWHEFVANPEHDHLLYEEEAALAVAYLESRRSTLSGKYVLTCYGEQYAVGIADPAEARQVAEDHIRTCPKGAMPWATLIEWHETDSALVSSSGGQWLNHHVRAA